MHVHWYSSSVGKQYRLPAYCNIMITISSANFSAVNNNYLFPKNATMFCCFVLLFFILNYFQENNKLSNLTEVQIKSKLIQKIMQNKQYTTGNCSTLFLNASCFCSK